MQSACITTKTDITIITQVVSPFIYNATRELLATSFQSPELEMPRRMAATPELYQKVDTDTDKNNQLCKHLLHVWHLQCWRPILRL